MLLFGLPDSDGQTARLYRVEPRSMLNAAHSYAPPRAAPNRAPLPPDSARGYRVGGALAGRGLFLKLGALSEPPRAFWRTILGLEVGARWRAVAATQGPPARERECPRWRGGSRAVVARAPAAGYS